MIQAYVDFFRELLRRKDCLSEYIDSLYKDEKYTEDDLNYIIGVLKKERLITCQYADNRAWNVAITYEGKHFFDNEEKPRIVALIESIDDIEELFHPIEDDESKANCIHDVQEFQNWFQEVNLELQNIYEQTNERYIWETLNLFNHSMNGRNDRKIFSELCGRLVAIKRNIDKYLSEEKNRIETMEDKKMNKTPMVFISHATKDSEYVMKIVDLLDGMGLNQTQIFCSSYPGYGIHYGMDIFEYLRKLFEEHELHVFFIHSENYYKSTASLNEMGAAWVLRSKGTSFLLPGFGYEQMDGVVNNRCIAIKLDGNEKEVKNYLNELYNDLVTEFGVTKKADIVWEQKRDQFITDILKLNNENEKESELSKEAVELMKLVSKDEKGCIYRGFKENGEIIMIGEKKLHDGSDHRESMKWIASLEQLIKSGYIAQRGESEHVYEITDLGYKYCDKMQN